MNGTAAKTLRLAALAAGLLFCGLPAGAFEAAETAAAGRLARYELDIASANPAAALAFLRDGEARELAGADPRRAAALLGKAEALKDLKELLSMTWDEARVNQLNGALAIRIDVDKPLARLGVGPEPEKLLAWMDKYQRTTEAKKLLVKKAIRQWEVIFGTMTTVQRLSWDQADMAGGRGVSVSKASWEAKVLRERNAILEKITDNDPRFLIYNDDRLAAARRETAIDMDVRAYIATLPPAQRLRLSGLPLEDQLYVLGSMFDNHTVPANPLLEAKIDAARSSMPQEVLPSEKRRDLGIMLNTAVAAELAGTQAGDRALAAFPGGLKITVAPVGSGYSRYDAATGSVVLDSETIQEYMRIKGYTAASVMGSRAQLTEIAKYMSPAVVYEAARKAQADWAARRGVYSPRVQEDEIEALALEGLYTTEKLARDPEFNNIMTSSRDFSSYAAKRVEIATEFKASRGKGFANTVRQRYFSGLPSLDAAAAQVLGAVTEELELRDALPPAGKAALEVNGLSLEETLEMSPDELASSVGEIRTPVLAKIQADLSGLGVYRSRYNASNRQNRKALRSLEAGTGTAPAVKGAPPPLI